MGIHHKKDAGYYCIVYYYWVLSLYSGITHCLSTLCYSKKRYIFYHCPNQYNQPRDGNQYPIKCKWFIQGLLWYIQRGIAQLFRASLATIFIFLSLFSVTMYIWLSLWLSLQDNNNCLVLLQVPSVAYILIMGISGTNLGIGISIDC